MAENGEMHLLGNSEERAVRNLLATSLIIAEGKITVELQAQPPLALFGELELRA